ncbi:MAG: Mor transcription activator family protein [Candidatus Binataceae bacterium]
MWSEDRRYVSRERLIELLGAAAAARVVEVFGAARIYMPEPESESYPTVTRKLGDETARRLCREYGGMQVIFPRRLVETRTEIAMLRQENLTAVEIARRLGCTERYVYAVFARERARQQQSGGE